MDPYGYSFDPVNPGMALAPGDPSAQPFDGSGDYGYATPIDQAPDGAPLAPQADYSKVAPVPANMLGLKVTEVVWKSSPILSGAALGVLGFLLGRKGKGKPKMLKLLAAAGAGIAAQKGLVQMGDKAPGARFVAAAGAGWLAGKAVK